MPDTLMSIDQFVQYVQEQTGIALSHSKIRFVEQGLVNRWKRLGVHSTPEYLQYMQTHTEERAEWLRLVTTNETYFFRELQHFNFLQDHMLPEHGGTKLRVWSSACSVGAEAYTVAMLLAEHDLVFEVVGSDINPEVVHQAKRGLYPMRWLDRIPDDLVKRYCLRGKDEYQGWFLINPDLAGRVHFQERNLLHHHPDLGEFDVIFLRNVLLYFTKETKERVLRNALRNLKRGGYLFVSRTEMISNLDVAGLEQMDTSIFRKTG